MIADLAALSRRAAWAGIVVLLLAILAAGCSNTRTVTVPAGESSVRTITPDTVKVAELPPVPPRGQATRPEEVIVYEDTAQRTFDVSLVEVDRTDPDEQSVRIRVEQGSVTVEKRLALPAVGEGLRVQPGDDADTAATNRPRDTPGEPLEETVFGAPTDYETEARVDSIERPWWTKLWVQVRLILAFAGGLVFGYVAVKLIPGL